MGDEWRSIGGAAWRLDAGDALRCSGDAAPTPGDRHKDQTRLDHVVAGRGLTLPTFKEMTALMTSADETQHADPDRFQLAGVEAPQELVNSVIRLLARHRSIRDYRPEPLPDGLLEVLVTAAQSASTSSNLQMYSIIAVRDPEKKRLLAEWSDNPFAAQAPLILVFCPDLHRLEMVSRRQGYDFIDRDMEMFIQAVVDTALAGQNTAIAAESLGLGICYLGGIRNQVAKVAELLRLPPRTFALFGMAIGYPARPSRVRHRLPMDVVLHHEAYSDDRLEEGLRRYDAVTAASGIYSGRHIPLPQAKEPQVYGWSEHTARRMARPNPNRRNMRQQLEALGWEF